MFTEVCEAGDFGGVGKMTDGDIHSGGGFVRALVAYEKDGEGVGEGYGTVGPLIERTDLDRGMSDDAVDGHVCCGKLTELLEARGM